MNFVSIDFETANAERNSACSMGIAVVENGEVVRTASWLIKPPKMYFNPYNTTIHGITEADVKDKPEFNELWDEIYPYLKGKPVIAHNASFDLSVLRHILDTYKLEYPDLTYYCSVALSKLTWTTLESYKLNNIASFLGFEFKHHDALEDAVTAARIVIEACKLNNIDSLEALSKKFNIQCGRLYPGGYTAATSKKPKKSKIYGPRSVDIVTKNVEFDKDHPCYKKVFVFTGTLASMPRKKAMQKVVDSGGSIADMVNERVDYLVAAHQDLALLKDGNQSVKEKMAELLMQKGYKIRRITEEEFLEMLKI